MSEVYNKEIKNKPYRLLYKMNEEIKIRVETPVGTTEEKKGWLYIWTWNK